MALILKFGNPDLFNCNTNWPEKFKRNRLLIGLAHILLILDKDDKPKTIEK